MTAAAAAAAEGPLQAHVMGISLFIFEHIRATLRSRRGFNVKQKSAASRNLLHTRRLGSSRGPRKSCSVYSCLIHSVCDMKKHSQ